MNIVHINKIVNEIGNEIGNDIDYIKLLSEISIQKKIIRNTILIKEHNNTKKIHKTQQLQKPTHMLNKAINKNNNKTNDTTDINDIICIDCNTFNIKELDGYYTCLECGLKIEHVIDSGQEWRFYGNDDNKGNDPARCDMPTNELLPSTSMGSFVGYSSRETSTTKRIRNMNNWYSIPYKESTLLDTFNNITNMAQSAGLNQCIIEEAKHMYKKISEIKSSRRSKKEGLKAGSIALACKIKGVPRNCAEIAKICHMDNNKILRKSIKTFEELWNNITLRDTHIIDALRTNIQYNNSESTSASENESANESIDESNDECIRIDKSIGNDKRIGNDKSNDTIAIEEDIQSEICSSDDITKLHRYISVLCLDDKIFQECKKLFIYIETHKCLDTHNPLSKIASIIYYVNEKYTLNINKHHIIQTCNVSEVTIHKCYQKILKNVKNY